MSVRICSCKLVSILVHVHMPEYMFVGECEYVSRYEGHVIAKSHTRARARACVCVCVCMYVCVCVQYMCKSVV